MGCICNDSILTEKSWAQMEKVNKDGMGIGIEDTNGTQFGLLLLSAFRFGVYFDRSKRIVYSNLGNEDLKLECVNGQWYYFRREARQELESLFTYPENTKMVPLSRKNLWNALNMTIEEKSRIMHWNASFLLPMDCAIRNAGLLWKWRVTEP